MLDLRSAIAAVLLALSGIATCRADDVPAIAAASDLKFALPVVVKAFESETGKTVKVTFGSSGVLATQIANGAPFEVLFSADEAIVKDLFVRGLLRDDGKIYGLGRLSVYAPVGSAVTCDADLTGLKTALAAGKVGKFAIANPEHAPYGRAARDALQKAGLWDGVAPHLVLGENISQTLQFAIDGGADAALVSAPLVEAPEFTGKGCHLRVSETLVAPLRQSMGVSRTSSATASAFAAFMISAKGQEILAKYGFSFPPAP